MFFSLFEGKDKKNLLVFRFPLSVFRFFSLYLHDCIFDTKFLNEMKEQNIDIKTTIEESDYKYGFSSDIETEFIPKPLFIEREEDKKPAYDSVVIPNFTPEKPEPAAVPAEDPERPKKKSKWGIISTKGYIGINLLMAIPVIGLILTIIWACGGCRKYAKRNYARAMLIFMAIGIILLIVGALVLRFVFPELIVQVFEMLYPGYTIVF